MFIGLSAPERFYKENAISVTSTVTRLGRCGITVGMNLKVRSQSAEGRRDHLIRVNICGALLSRRYDVRLPANPEKLASQARHESVAPQELFAARTMVGDIVKNRLFSCLSRVSHRVIFRRNRALSCYIVSKIRNLFFGHSISALRALKGSCCSLPLLDGCAFVPQAS